MTTAEGTIFESRGTGKCKACGKWYTPKIMLVKAAPSGVRHLHPEDCARALPSVPVVDGQRSGPEWWTLLELVGRDLEAHPFRVAKTMPDVPHAYTLRKQWADGAAFTRMVRAIKMYGLTRKWRTMRNRYLDVNEHYYWSMDARECPSELEYLINRAVRADYEPDPSGWFPKWPTPTDHQQQYLRSLVGGLRGRTVLDIGGAWDDAVRRAKQYLAVGWQEDVARVQRRYPHAAVIKTRLGWFVPRTPHRFDVVAAVFGAANRLSLEELNRLPLLTTPAGVALAMFQRGARTEVDPPFLATVWPKAELREGRTFTILTWR